jgi:UDP-glucose 4-epimerase
MRILVTGGSGLVGRYVVDELAKDNTVDVLDIKTPQRPDLTYIRADVLDLSALKKTVSVYDAVVHLAGIPHPLNNPADEVFRVNSIGTFNMLEACAVNGIKKFVLMSSESTLGFAFALTRMVPLYFPIDEQHPLRPEDPYGLSKVTCELLCEGYSRRFGMSTVCLRAPWIWVPEEKERKFYRQLIAEYPKWYKNLWAFVHVIDVAHAVANALRAQLDNLHERFFITADRNWTGKDSRELAGQFYPEVTDFRSEFIGAASFISSDKAKKVLRFHPRMSANDIVP